MNDRRILYASAECMRQFESPSMNEIRRTLLVCSIWILTKIRHWFYRLHVSIVCTSHQPVTLSTGTWQSLLRFCQLHLERYWYNCMTLFIITGLHWATNRRYVYWGLSTYLTWFTSCLEYFERFCSRLKTFAHERTMLAGNWHSTFDNRSKRQIIP